jgi:hypothetical protein
VPEKFVWNNFSAGWRPSDDQFNGDKAGLPKMDNLELDETGALALQGGINQIGGVYPSVAHDLFSNFVGSTRYDYVATTDGEVFCNGTSIITGGDGLNTAFGQAFDYTLICSGSQRKKTIGCSTVINLGVGAPTAAPTLATDWNRTAFMNPTSINTIVGTVPGIGAPMNAQTAAYGSSYACIFNAASLSPTPINFNLLQDPYGGIEEPTADDRYWIFFQTQSGGGGDLTNVTSIEVDLLLVDPGTSQNLGSDYYSYTWINPGTTTGSILNLYTRRSDWVRVGTGTQDWSAVYGARYTIITTVAMSTYIASYPALGGFTQGNTGQYQYMQVNVNSNGAYVGKSAAGPIASITLDDNFVKVTPQAPTDPQVNEVWIFRRGGTLDQWYRVLVIKSPWAQTYDDMTDEEALTLGITYDVGLSSITTITDKIFAIVGPIEGRWWYFTTSTMYPSDINSPDTVNTSLGVRITGSQSEIFLWAKRVADNAVVVGTSRDCYLLTGTFITLPDGTVDIYYRSLGCKFPPISYDATFQSGIIYYISSDGWRTIDGSGANQLLTFPATVNIYYGYSSYGYSVNTKVAPGSVRFPCVFGRNRLWCSVAAQGRTEVFDPSRGYWRNFNTQLGQLYALTSTQDGRVLGFFSTGSGGTLEELDIESSSLVINGQPQSISAMSQVFDGGTPKQRHEFYTVKVRFSSNVGETLSVAIVTEGGTSTTLGLASGNSITNEFVFDCQSVSVPLSRWWYFTLSGTFTEFVFVDLELNYDTRPLQLTSLHLLPDNFGVASNKRVRTWPHVIDTLGNTVNFTPIVDGVSQAVTQWSTTRKQTVFHYFTNDVFGVDYEFWLKANSGVFEYFGPAQAPEVVQVLPISKEFDQVGPEELFKYGRIKQIELRVLPHGNLIPWEIFFNDNSIQKGQLTVIPEKEYTYFIEVQNGNAGTIVRITLGPTTFTFHRYYMRLLCHRTGLDTNLEWVTLPPQGVV